MEHSIISRRSSTLSLNSSSSHSSDESFSSDPSFSWADDSDALPPLSEPSLLDYPVSIVGDDEWTPPRPAISWSQEQALRDAITFAFTGETKRKSLPAPVAAPRRSSPPYTKRSATTLAATTTTTSGDGGDWRKTAKGTSWSWNEAKGGYVLVNATNPSSAANRSNNSAYSAFASTKNSYRNLRGSSKW